MSTAPTSQGISWEASNDAFTCVQKVVGVRVRQEQESSFLLYQPTTDELHLVDARGKAVFDLCDGRSINEVVISGARLLFTGDVPDSTLERAEREVFAFLQHLQARSLVAWA